MVIISTPMPLMLVAFVARVTTPVRVGGVMTTVPPKSGERAMLNITSGTSDCLLTVTALGSA